MKSTFMGGLALALVCLVACQTKEEPKPTIPASDDKVMVVQHPVADYAAWRPFFDAHDSVRTSNGISVIAVGRKSENPNELILFFRLMDVDKAKAFSSSPELKAIMDSAGVTGPPGFDFVQAVRNDTSKTPVNDRVIIKHRVKDFDAWLKVYDNEGMEKRKEHGIVDRALARGMDDPNMVYVVFAITDWEKANARMASEDLKKIMTDAGVEGTPEFTRYTLQ